MSCTWAPIPSPALLLLSLPCPALPHTCTAPHDWTAPSSQPSCLPSCQCLRKATPPENTTPHCPSTLHTSLHHTAPQLSILHYTTQPLNSPHSTGTLNAALNQFTSILHYTATLHYTAALNCNAVHCNVLWHCTTMQHCNTLHYIVTLHCSTLHCTNMNDCNITVQYIALHCNNSL